jgi:hypothetical protein
MWGLWSTYEQASYYEVSKTLENYCHTVLQLQAVRRPVSHFWYRREVRLEQNAKHHLVSTEATKARWAKISHLYYRTAPIYDPENDFRLIYAYDNFEISNCC